MSKQQMNAGGERSTAEKVREKVGEAREQVQETASNVAAGARDRGEQLLDGGREKAHELTERATELARSRADQEKERVTNGIRTFADALRRGSSDLTGDRDQFRPLLNGAADRVERVSAFLESRDVDTLTQDVRRFAREHTPLFLTGAFALGFLGSRFLKSSGDRASTSRLADTERFESYQSEDRFDRILPESGTRDVAAGGTARSFDASGGVTGGGYE